jgi:P-type Ca2+ transporter type 2C
MAKGYHAITADEAARSLRTDVERGLADEEVLRRRAETGPNALPEEPRESVFLVFLRQFQNILIAILLGAAAISFIADERKDGVAILIAVLVNVIFGFIQERRAEDAIRKLRTLIVHEASVLRGGNVHRVPAEDLVPGDVILLQEGDHVPADARLVTARDLSAAEASLTGESSAVRKVAAPVDAEAALADRASMVWMGTSVVSGEAKAVVVETGIRTEFGQIADSLQRIRRERTPFERRIDLLGRQLGVFAVALAGVLFAMGTARGFDAGGMFFFAVAMMVSVIPEGLPAVLAVVLAIGVQRMARRNAVIRHIPSVETLGVCDVICTDKTGTLTENKMTVREIATSAYDIAVSGEGWRPEGEFSVGGNAIRPTEIAELDELLKSAALCTKAALEWKEDRAGIVGDPTEGALVVLAAKAGIGKPSLAKEYRSIDDIPFSSERKFRAVLVERTDFAGERSRHILVTGAYDVLHQRITHVVDRGRKEAFGAEARRRFDAANDGMAERVMRILCVAVKRAPLTQGTLADADIEGLTLLGLVAMIDPPRDGVAEAIARARLAGVRVIMITGDQKATALAIAREVGLVDGAGHDRRVFTEHDLAGLSDAAFAERIRDAAVFARVSPSTKLRIVGALQAMGHTVAMTGDGVNDAPALKKASIGISMGISGTDVSKEVADMVLADDNFVSIVNAIEEGRTVFRNIQSTAAFLFMTNVGEVVTVLAALAFGFPLPLLPVQILWMNLVTDSFPGMALSAEPSDEGVLREKPRPKSAPVLTKDVFALTALTAALMCAGSLALFAWKLGSAGIDEARSVAFTAMAMFQLWNVFTLRNLRVSAFALGMFSNRYVTAAVVASVGLQLAVLYVPSLSAVFSTVPVSAADWAVILVVSSSVFFAAEAYKFAARRRWLPASLRA